MFSRLPSTILVYVASLAAAHASFELVMVADAGTKSIHRFDGSSGVYLGSFGGGFLGSVDSFVIDSSTGRAFVGDYTSQLVRVFNYNTGVHLSDYSFLGTYGLHQTLGRATGGTLVSGYLSGGFSLYSDSGIFQGYGLSQAVGGATSSCMASSSHTSGRFIGATYHSSSAIAALQVFDSTPGNAVLKSAEVTDMGTWSTRSQITTQGTRGAWISASRQLRYFTTDAAASILTMGASNSLSTTLGTSTNYVGTAFGHGNTVYYSGLNSANTSGVINRTVYGSGSVLGSFGNGILQQPGMIQVVVAPEPGSLAILGLGLAGLLRKRRVR